MTFARRASAWLWSRSARYGRWPPKLVRIGRVDFGDFADLRPVSTVFGLDRGTPIDRIYIERFLAAHADDLRGVVLEIADDTYSTRFGAHRLQRVDVLHATPGNTKATIEGSLADGLNVSGGQYDCLVVTQTLNCIYDVKAAIRELHRLLHPGGVLLATAPGISQVSRYDMERWGDYWRFTSLSLRLLLEEAFGVGNVEIQSHGNALAAVAFLQGVAAEEVSPDALQLDDRDYEVILTARAVRTT